MRCSGTASAVSGLCRVVCDGAAWRGFGCECVVPGRDDVVVYSTASASMGVSPAERTEVLFEELAELAGQRNAIDTRIVEIAAEIDRDDLCGAAGARSVAALLARKLGSSSATAHTIATVAHRLEEFPRCAAGMRQGRLSLDQVGVVAARAGAGSDSHAQLAQVATVNQLRTAVKLEPRPDPTPARIRNPRSPAPRPRNAPVGGSPWGAKFDAALASHCEALIAEWQHDRGNGAGASESTASIQGHRGGVLAPGRGRMGC